VLPIFKSRVTDQTTITVMQEANILQENALARLRDFLIIVSQWPSLDIKMRRTVCLYYRQSSLDAGEKRQCFKD